VADATRQQLTTAAATTTHDLESATAAAAGEIQVAAHGVGREIDHAATETETVVSEPEYPFLPGVREQVTAARTGIVATAAGGRQQLATAASGADAHLQAAVAAFGAAVGPAVEAAGVQFGQIADGFATAADRAQASRTEAAAGVLDGLRQQQ